MQDYHKLNQIQVKYYKKIMIFGLKTNQRDNQKRENKKKPKSEPRVKKPYQMMIKAKQIMIKPKQIKAKSIKNEPEPTGSN